MKKIIFISLLMSQSVWAHHTSEHTMLTQDAEQVIAETQAGSNDSGTSLLWLIPGVLLGLGIIRLFNKK